MARCGCRGLEVVAGQHMAVQKRVTAPPAYPGLRGPRCRLGGRASSLDGVGGGCGCCGCTAVVVVLDEDLGNDEDVEIDRGSSLEVLTEPTAIGSTLVVLIDPSRLIIISFCRRFQTSALLIALVAISAVCSLVLT